MFQQDTFESHNGWTGEDRSFPGVGEFVFGAASFDDVSQIDEMNSLKRKDLDEIGEAETKRNKLELADKPASFANVIEETSFDRAVGGRQGGPQDEVPLMLDDQEVLALSDALSEDAISSDSFDEGESGEDESADEDNEEAELGDDEDDDAVSGKAQGGGRPSGGKTVQGVRRKASAAGATKKQQSITAAGAATGAGKKARGNYACSKCGLPKRGHVCMIQPRVRRRPAAAAAAAAAAAGMTSAGPFTGHLATSKHVTARQAQKMRTAAAAAAAASLAKVAEDAKPLKPFTVSPTTASSASVAAAAKPVMVDSAAGSCTEYGTPPAALPVVDAPRVPVIRMCHAETQCELDSGNTVRELYLDSQGFPESYAQGILADPTFCVATARTITVSRPPPKNYKPSAPSKTTSSCGPDGLFPAAAPAGSAAPASAASSLLQAAAAAAAAAGGGLLGHHPFAPSHLHHRQPAVAPASASAGAAPSTSQLLQQAAAAAAASAHSPGGGSAGASAPHPLAGALFGSAAAAAAAGSGNGSPPAAAAPTLTLNHLALLMSSYQNTLVAQQQQQQQAKQQAQQTLGLAPSAGASGSGSGGGLDHAALASLLASGGLPVALFNKQHQKVRPNTDA